MKQNKYKLFMLYVDKFILDDFIVYFALQMLILLFSLNYQQIDECIKYQSYTCNQNIYDILNLAFDQNFINNLQYNNYLDKLLYLNAHNEINVYNITQTQDDQIIIAGDLHGDGQNFINLINQTYSENTKYIFLGDYVDRGQYSLQIVVSILLLRLQYPQQFIFLSGNHENLKVNKRYGFIQDIEYYNLTKYLDKIEAFYNNLPIASFIHTKFINTSNSLQLQQQFNNIQASYQYEDIPATYLLVHGGAFFYYKNFQFDQNKNLYDLLMDVDTQNYNDSVLFQIHWNDPNQVNNFDKSKRGSSCITYGMDQAHDFFLHYNIDGLFRGHQVVKYVRDDFNDGSHFTVYSQGKGGNYVKLNSTGIYFIWINEQSKDEL